MGLDFLYGIGTTFAMIFETIFTNFIAYDNVELDNRSIIDYCNSKQREDEKGRILSNVGGWQSNDQHIGNTTHPEILKLTSIVEKRFRNLGNKLEFNGPENIKISNFWININKQSDQNNPHDHPDTIFVAVYYAKVPENSGNIILKTPVNKYDHFIKHEQIKKYNTYNSSIYTYNPTVGKLVMFPAWLIHYVEPNQKEEERISIAFNGSFK